MLEGIVGKNFEHIRLILNYVLSERVCGFMKAKKALACIVCMEYCIAQNFDSAKVWWMIVESSKFSQPKFALSSHCIFYGYNLLTQDLSCFVMLAMSGHRILKHFRPVKKDPPVDKNPHEDKVLLDPPGPLSKVIPLTSSIRLPAVMLKWQRWWNKRNGL